MPITPRSSEGITSLEGFLDNVIKFANESADHNTGEFMSKLQKRILSAMRKKDTVVHDNVLQAYFRMYALMNAEKVSRTRIIATAEAVVGWLRN